MDLGLSGRNAAVAAASRGLGFAAAAALAAEGARVAVCSRDRARIEAAAAAVGPGTVPLVHDVSAVDDAAAFVLEAEAALGGIDILVTNSGGPPVGGFADTEIGAYAEAFDANARSAIAMTQVAVPPMRRQGWGRIVAITTLGVRQPPTNLILSNVARAGLTAFLRTLATTLAADGITVNSVQPGLHDTERLREIFGDDVEHAARGLPPRRLGAPSDFGSVVAFLCSEQANFVNGVALQVDGGTYPGLQ